MRARDAGADILVLKFEDMRRKPLDILREVTAFVGIDATAERMREALERNTASRMRGLEEASVDYLRQSVGYRSRGVRDGAGARGASCSGRATCESWSPRSSWPSGWAIRAEMEYHNAVVPSRAGQGARPAVPDAGAEARSDRPADGTAGTPARPRWRR